MSEVGGEIVGDHEVAGHNGSDIASESSYVFSDILNDAEAENEDLLAKACEQAYMDCIDPGANPLSWRNRSNESEGVTPCASSYPDPPSHIEHSKPHLPPSQQINLPFHSILHLNIPHALNGVDEKGKGKMTVNQLEAEAVIWESDQATSVDECYEGGGGLTCAEKDEQSRRDAELSLLLLAQELLEQGVPQEEVASYAFQTQLFAMSSHPKPAAGAPCYSPMSAPYHISEEDRLDLDRIARRTVDGVAARPLPPAYGPYYSPEPSTSQAGSPILAVRRSSISSTISSISMSSASSAVPSSTYTVEEEDELVQRMQRFLDERYESNKVAILAYLDRQAQKKQKLEEGNRTHHWGNAWRDFFKRGGEDGRALAKTVEDGVRGDRQQQRQFPLPSPPSPLPISTSAKPEMPYYYGGRGTWSAAAPPQGPTTTSQRGPDQSPTTYLQTPQGADLG